MGGNALILICFTNVYLFKIMKDRLIFYLLFMLSFICVLQSLNVI